MRLTFDDKVCQSKIVIYFQHYSNDAFQSYYDIFQFSWLVQTL